MIKPTSTHTQADKSLGYRLAVCFMVALAMAKWLDAQTWLPFGIEHTYAHFIADGIATFCGVALGFCPSLRRRTT